MENTLTLLTEGGRSVTEMDTRAAEARVNGRRRAARRETTMGTRYEFRHDAGYGRDDHMADEIMARAARRLGIETGSRIAQCVGLASHAVPMGSVTYSLPARRGVRRGMETALRQARTEVLARDCCIYVACVRTRAERRYDGGYDDVTERREGHTWVIEYRARREATA